jgi:hypothetical protein
LLTYLYLVAVAAGSECTPDSSVLAPAGCTQFHFGSQGSVKSFNFEGVQYLNNQVSNFKQTGWVLRIFNLLYPGFTPAFILIQSRLCR